MQTNTYPDLSNFFAIGINYKKTDAATRGLFAIGSEQYDSAVSQAETFGLGSFFILSTCNRTEIYGFADNARQLIHFICSQTRGDETTFNNLAYIKKGREAIGHLFNVGAGLDSQILGDYEIVGQLKQAVKFAKERGCINAFLERLVNTVLQSSKEIKNETPLSGGTVSVSFAAVQYIKEHLDDCAARPILLAGTGKIGRNTCRNLVDYLGARNITLVNRTEDKATRLAAELGLKSAPLSTLPQLAAGSDIILVATSAGAPTILKAYLENKGPKLVIDLSVPSDVEAGAASLPNVTLVNVDELSKLRDETLKMREAGIPAAHAIIARHMGEFEAWCRMRKNAPLLNIIKTRLNEIAVIHQREFANPQTRCPYIAAEQKIQQVVNNIAGKMREQDQPGCYYLQAIVDFVRSDRNGG
ncbi:MAG: glutamyl-tRNA reductase [Bacteroidetes bacterium]|nr:glutamyl-tRNA reductase [Bacteroidota bacterium]